MNEKDFTERIIRIGNLATSYTAAIQDFEKHGPGICNYFEHAIQGLKKRRRQIRKKYNDLNKDFNKKFRPIRGQS